MSDRRGFTLIELLVVVVIVSLLSSLALASLSESRAKARNASRNSLVVQYRTALELYRSDHGGLYPDTVGWTVCLGDYPNNNCGVSGTTESPALNSALRPYIPSLPPVSLVPIKITFGDFMGATYSHDLSHPGEPLIVWVLEGFGQACVGGAAIPIPQEFGDITICNLRLK